MHRYIFTFIAFIGSVSIILFSSCNKAEEATFTVPSAYRFNSPNLAEKNVYLIDQLSKKGKLITDSLGDFNRSNTVISDSLNYIIRKSFLVNSLRTITFKDGNNALLEFGKLDTTGGKSVIIPLNSKDSKYTLSGNNIKFEAFPEYYAEVTNSFLEVNLCQEFTLRSRRNPTGNVKTYFHTNCTDVDHSKIITRIINENPSIIYDTISIERINYIFSKY
jgi:hypothetical protein